MTEVMCAGGCPLGSLASDLSESDPVARVQLAVAMLAAVQGGLLLSQVRRDPAPLRIAVDTMIDHLHALTR